MTFTKEHIKDYIEDMKVQGWTMFRHPLCVMVPFMNSDFEIQNILKSIEYKTKAIQKTDSLHSYIWMHERPFRLQAYLTCPPKFEEQKTKELLIKLWVDCEAPYINRNYWLDLFSQLDWEDSKKDLPDMVSVYRGSVYENGLSWSLSYEVAEMFSKRGSKTTKVWSTVVDKKDIILYTNERGEEEVILDLKQ